MDEYACDSTTIAKLFCTKRSKPDLYIRICAKILFVQRSFGDDDATLGHQFWRHHRFILSSRLPEFVTCLSKEDLMDVCMVPDDEVEEVRDLVETEVSVWSTG